MQQGNFENALQIIRKKETEEKQFNHEQFAV